MTKGTEILLAAGLGLAMLTGCGFKSDLFIPGKPDNAGQMDSESMQSLKQQTLENLDTEDSEIFNGVTQELPSVSAEDGVPVVIEPLSKEDIEKLKGKKNNQ